MIRSQLILMVGVPVNSLAGDPGPHQQNDSRLNDTFHTVRTVALCWETYVFSSSGSKYPLAASLCTGFAARHYYSQIHFETDDPGTHAEKKGPVLFGSASYGWLIRATGSMMLRNTPTSRSTESKTVPDWQRGKAIA
jgi:hypothetical protein